MKCWYIQNVRCSAFKSDLYNIIHGSKHPHFLSHDNNPQHLLCLKMLINVALN